MKRSVFKYCLLFGGVGSKFVPRDLESSEFNHLNRQWNLRKKTVYPLGIFLPTTARDVAKVVKCGLMSRIHLVPSSGGHSYEEIGSGSNNTVVVDFRNMRSIRIEGTGENAIGVFEPGANVAQINAYLWENGGYGLPMGNCYTVGIGGHAIGGGVGAYGTLYGLAVDRITEIEVVTARGDIVVASKYKNKELFWALRGSGPGYLGIVTKMKASLFEASKLQMTVGMIHYHIKDFAEGYIRFQNFLKWAQENDPTVFISFKLASDAWSSKFPPLVPGIQILGLHMHDPTHQPNGNQSFLQAIQTIFPAPGRLMGIIYPNYIQFVGMTGYAPSVLRSPFTSEPTPVGTFASFYKRPLLELPNETRLLEFYKIMRRDDTAPRYFKAKSFFIKKYFEKEEMQKVADVLVNIPRNDVWILCNSEMGQIQQVGKNESSYVHRDSLLGLTIHYEGPADPDRVKPGMKFMYKLWETVQFMDGGETYQNYPDLEVNDYLERTWKTNLPRLIEAKRKWDPRNYFLTPLSIPPRPTRSTPAA